LPNAVILDVTRPVLCAALAIGATCVALPATASAANVAFQAASSDGSRVFFSTTERLVAADTDSSTDLYQRSGGVTTLVSTGPDGGNGAFDAGFRGASADGSRVFFETDEKLVTPADTDSVGDVYERSGGVTTLISTGPNGGNGASNAFFAGVSEDGSRVFFTTDEKLVTPADADAATDIYKRSSGATTLISTGPNGGNGTPGVTFEGATPDGGRVFFETAEKLVTVAQPVDTDSSTDVYERSAGATTLISTGPNGGSGAPDASFQGASTDGTRVFFLTFEKLVTPTDGDAGPDIYQRSGGATTLISTGPNDPNGGAAISFEGASTDGTRVFFNSSEKLVVGDTDSKLDGYQRSAGVTTQMTTGPTGGNGPDHATIAGASADGTRVFFGSNEQLVAADGDSDSDVYQRSGHTTTLISTGPNGGNGVGFAEFKDASADGSRVFFDTPERLVTPADADAASDIYERSGAATTLISTGPNGSNADENAVFKAASEDGSRVFFTTSERVVKSTDLDAEVDVYQRSGGITTLVSIAGDTDGDAVLDPSDNCALVPNATQTDTDGDAQGDACDADDDADGVLDGPDNCELVSNPSQTDSDVDGQGDACDGDTDGDGVLDGPDNCPAASNATQTDTDGDGQGDACDADDDADGVLDGPDNCELVSNASQTNSDTDALGDACDPDDDNDTVLDGSDNCALAPNPTQVNSDLQAGGDACDPDDDNDGLTDVAEAFRKTNRLDKDSDDDGLLDAREVNVTKTRPARFDSDGDGLSDGLELGLTKGIADPPGAIVATRPAKFRKDRDPKTKTKPLKKDTDGDGLADGAEDKNRNGRREKTETDPRKKDTDGDGFSDKKDRKPLNKQQH
jgi:hypothetical protein